MTTVYKKVIAAGLTDYLVARLQLPSNLHFREWEALAHTDDIRLIYFLKYSFRMRYEGPVPTPADNNHAFAVHHPWDVAAYMSRGVK